MNTKYIFFIILATTISTSAMANKSVVVKHFKDLKKVSLKCHVQLNDGKSDVITHYNLPIKDRSLFESQLLNKNISPNNKDKIIYKVTECVELGETFSDSEVEKAYNSTKINR